GCSSSIAAALGSVDPRADMLVLMLGDQPGVTADTVATLVAVRGAAPLAACTYDDGRGPRLVFGWSMFGALSYHHGDEAVWRRSDWFADEVVDVAVAGPIPRDVDTWEDYEALLAS